MANPKRRREILRRTRDKLKDLRFTGFGGLSKQRDDLVAAVKARIAGITRNLNKPDVRVKPNVVIVRTSPNQSDRISPIRLIVLHSTESKPYAGSGDLESLGNWFANPSADVSSHVATDDDGNSGRYVPDSRKAWHCAAFNSPSLGIEQIGYASQSTWPSKQLDETARWIALWSKAYGVPIQRGAVSGSSVTRSGVVTHKDLGSAGGGHWDPGPDYPFDYVLKRARYFAAA